MIFTLNDFVQGLWSSGMMPALGAGDREFDSPKSPLRGCDSNANLH